MVGKIGRGGGVTQMLQRVALDGVTVPRGQELVAKDYTVSSILDSSE